MADELATTYSTARSPIDPHDILALFNQRENDSKVEFQRMNEARMVIHGDVDLPTTEMMTDEKPAVVNVSKMGMQQTARRIASVLPEVHFPAMTESDLQDRRAADKTRIVKSWHEENHIQKVLAQRARWMLAYAKAPCLVVPDLTSRLPVWQPISPFDVFAAPVELGEMIPKDVVIKSETTYRYLQKFYPKALSQVYKSKEFQKSDGEWMLDCHFTLLRYISDNYVALILKGHDPGKYDYGPQPPESDVALLEWAPNNTGIPLMVIPQAISLDHPQGQYDDILGMQQAQAKLMSMQMIAQQRAVWPREWLEANPGEEPVIRSIPEPAQGKPGRVRGGKIVPQKIDPSAQTLELMDRLEYAARMTAGVPPEFGGQGATNIRTARRGGQILGQTIDFLIAETQDLLAESLHHENVIAMEIDKAYFNTKKSYFISSPSYNGKIDYLPSQLWESTNHIVRHPMSGTDSETLTLTVGQRLGMEVMSKETAMRLDPLIEDAELELKRVELEAVKRGMIMSLEAQAQNPEGPYSPVGYAYLRKKMLEEDMDLEDALIAMQEEAQQKQMMETEGPAAQPGMALPGEEQTLAEAGPIPEVQPSQQHLAQLLGSLYTTQAATKSRAPIAGPAQPTR